MVELALRVACSIGFVRYALGAMPLSIRCALPMILTTRMEPPKIAREG